MWLPMLGWSRREGPRQGLLYPEREGGGKPAASTCDRLEPLLSRRSAVKENWHHKQTVAGNARRTLCRSERRVVDHARTVSDEGSEGDLEAWTSWSQRLESVPVGRDSWPAPKNYVGEGAGRTQIFRAYYASTRNPANDGLQCVQWTHADSQPRQPVSRHATSLQHN